jgi:hypothetical protein
LHGLQFIKLENYVGFDVYGYSHELETKLYHLQLMKLEIYVGFDAYEYSHELKNQVVWFATQET